MTETERETPKARITPYDGPGELLRGSAVSVLPQARKCPVGTSKSEIRYRKKYLWKYTLKNPRNGKVTDYEETLPEDESPSLIDFVRKYGGMEIISVTNKVKL